MKFTTAKSIKSLKLKLKKALPKHVMKVVLSYEAFLEQEIPDNAKGFSAHHSACKSAVAHIETLLKLAKWAEDEFDFIPETKQQDITEIINKAREELNKLDDE